MFDRFIKNKMCVDIMVWLLNHSTGDYDAAIIAHDIEAENLEMFTTALFILDELDIIGTNTLINDDDVLRVIFNEDSLIVQSFRTLKDIFNDEAYRNSNVCGVLADFATVYDNTSIYNNDLVEAIRSSSNEFIDLFLDMFKNYKFIKFDDDPIIAEKQKFIQNEARRLDEAGELDNFIDFINTNRK